MKRFIVIVLDGFGMSAMADAATARPGDEIATTFGSILQDFPELKLPTLEKMGLMNAYGKESAQMHFSEKASSTRFRICSPLSPPGGTLRSLSPEIHA